MHRHRIQIFFYWRPAPYKAQYSRSDSELASFRHTFSWFFLHKSHQLCNVLSLDYALGLQLPSSPTPGLQTRSARSHWSADRGGASAEKDHLHETIKLQELSVQEEAIGRLSNVQWSISYLESYSGYGYACHKSPHLHFTQVVPFHQRYGTCGCCTGIMCQSQKPWRKSLLSPSLKHPSKSGLSTIPFLVRCTSLVTFFGMLLLTIVDKNAGTLNKRQRDAEQVTHLTSYVSNHYCLRGQEFMVQRQPSLVLPSVKSFHC